MPEHYGLWQRPMGTRHPYLPRSRTICVLNNPRNTRNKGPPPHRRNTNMSYEYNPANLGHPLYRQPSQGEQRTGVVQCDKKCPGVIQSDTKYLGVIQKPTQPSTEPVSPSSNQPQPNVTLPTHGNSEGGSLAMSSSRTDKFEFETFLPTNSSSSNCIVVNSSSIMPAIASSSRATPNVASGCNLLRQMDPRPKLPLSRLMQVQSWQRLKILAFHLQEVPPNVVISAEHALVATIPPTSTKPSSPTTSGRAGSSSPEPETTPLDNPQTSGTHSQPVEALVPGSSMDWSSGTMLASSSSKTAGDGDLQNPIVTISQRGTEAMSMLAPNITIEYRGPVPTFSTPFQPPVRINVL